MKAAGQDKAENIVDQLLARGDVNEVGHDPKVIHWVDRVVDGCASADDLNAVSDHDTCIAAAIKAGLTPEQASIAHELILQKFMSAARV